MYFIYCIAHKRSKYVGQTGHALKMRQNECVRHIQLHQPDMLTAEEHNIEVRSPQTVKNMEGTSIL